MRGEWAYYESLLTPEQCDRLIAAGIQSGIGDGTVTTSNKVDSTIRKSSIGWIDREHSEFGYLFRVMDRCVAEANRSWFGVDYWGIDTYQFTVYDAEQGHFYDLHQDSWIASTRPADRKISFTLQLSDPGSYKGGDFRIRGVSQQPPAEALRTRGTAVLFPSIIWHGVSKITEGTRYSVVGWYEGPNWR